MFVQQQLELVPEPRRGQLTDEPHVDARSSEGDGVTVHAEPVAVLVADRAEDPGRVVDERKVVQDANDPRLEIGEAAEEVDQASEVLTSEGHRHRIDGEVAPVEILPDWSGLDARQGRGLVVELRSGRRDVDAAAFPDDDGRPELLVGNGSAAEDIG